MMLLLQVHKACEIQSLSVSNFQRQLKSSNLAWVCGLSRLLLSETLLKYAPLKILSFTEKFHTYLQCSGNAFRAPSLRGFSRLTKSFPKFGMHFATSYYLQLKVFDVFESFVKQVRCTLSSFQYHLYLSGLMFPEVSPIALNGVCLRPIHTYAYEYAGLKYGVILRGNGTDEEDIFLIWK